jgi:hypothetical protein
MVVRFVLMGLCLLQDETWWIDLGSRDDRDDKVNSVVIPEPLGLPHHLDVLGGAHQDAAQHEQRRLT